MFRFLRAPAAFLERFARSAAESGDDQAGEGKRDQADPLERLGKPPGILRLEYEQTTNNGPHKNSEQAGAIAAEPRGQGDRAKEEYKKDAIGKKGVPQKPQTQYHAPQQKSPRRTTPTP